MQPSGGKLRRGYCSPRESGSETSSQRHGRTAPAETSQRLSRCPDLQGCGRSGEHGFGREPTRPSGSHKDGPIMRLIRWIGCTTWSWVSSRIREIELRGDRLESVGLLAPFLAPRAWLRKADLHVQIPVWMTAAGSVIQALLRLPPTQASQLRLGADRHALQYLHPCRTRVQGSRKPRGLPPP
jgi:hypothetical protein